MWRLSKETDEQQIVEMSLALYTEDPAAGPVPAGHTRQTLSMLRAEPARGRAVILELDDRIAGYAFLISFWSNELGGEVIVIDELYIRAHARSQGHARNLFRTLCCDNPLWPSHPVALELEVTPENKRATALYTNLGFTRIKNARLRLLL
jgi:GNAT superfamily N-acetyltransferase